MTERIPERMGLDAIRQAIEDLEATEQKYHTLADQMIYQGNSVSWWHSKATAYRNAVDAVWDALRLAGITADGKKTCADGVRELAARAQPSQPLTDERVSAVVRSVQPHLDTNCKAWRELAEECRYWLEADRAITGDDGSGEVYIAPVAAHEAQEPYGWVPMYREGEESARVFFKKPTGELGELCRPVYTKDKTP